MKLKHGLKNKLIMNQEEIKKIKEDLEKLMILSKESLNKTDKAEYYNWDLKCELLTEEKEWIDSIDFIIENLGKITDQSETGYVQKSIDSEQRRNSC